MATARGRVYSLMCGHEVPGDSLTRDCDLARAFHNPAPRRETTSSLNVSVRLSTASNEGSLSSDCAFRRFLRMALRLSAPDPNRKPLKRNRDHRRVDQVMRYGAV